MSSPLPVVKQPPTDAEVVVSYRPAEEIEADRLATKSNFDQLKQELEKQREEAKKNLDTSLKTQKELYSGNFRTGTFGILGYAFQNSNKILSNLTDTIKDSFGTLAFGKTVSDVEAEANLQTRTTLVERLLSGEKYKDNTEIIEATEELKGIEAELKRLTEEQKQAKAEAKKGPRPAPAKPKDPIETVVNVPEIIAPAAAPVINIGNSDFDLPEQSVDNEVKKGIPILESINSNITGLYDKFASFYDDNIKNRIADKREEASKSVIDSVKSKPAELLGNIKDKASNWSIPIVAGMGGLLTTIAGTVTGVLLATGKLLLKAIPIAGLAAGLLLTVKDAIGGWFSAESWGVSKISGMFGGLIAGLDSGVMGALKNGGKWALIGAGIGSFVPVIGTLFGGLIGGAIGAILGLFGGEKVAQFFDSIGGLMMEGWEYIKGGFNFIVDKFWGIVDTANGWIDYLTSFSFDGLKTAFVDGWNNLVEKIKGYVTKMFSWDYWFGDEPEEPEQNNMRHVSKEQVEVIDSEGNSKTIEVAIPKIDPIKVEEQDAKALDNLSVSFDKFADKYEGEKAEIRNDTVNNIYERTIDNSSSNTSNNNYSRSMSQNVVSNSNNKSSVNIMSMPSVKNNEASAFGTQTLQNSGRFNMN